MMKDYLEEIMNKNSAQNFMTVTEAENTHFDPTKFSNVDEFMPLMKPDENGRYKSDLLTLLTQRPTVYGPALGVSQGIVFTDDEDEVIWKAEDGETVVGWMHFPSTKNIKADINFNKVLPTRF